MSALRTVLLASNLALAALVVATLWADLGWTHGGRTLAYVALVAVAVPAWPVLRKRRITSLLMATLGAWGLVTGLYLVYVTPFHGERRWMLWWHGVTSVGFFLAFLAHWTRNNPRLVGLARQLAARAGPATAFALAWGALLAFGAATWSTDLRTVFSDQNFIALSTLALGLAGVGAYYAFLAARLPTLREKLLRAGARNPLRGAVDVSLLLATWLATLTGFALLYFGRALRAMDALWLTTWWHVATSALLAGIVGAHLLFNLRFLRAHAGRVDREIATLRRDQVR